MSSPPWPAEAFSDDADISPGAPLAEEYATEAPEAAERPSVVAITYSIVVEQATVCGQQEPAPEEGQESHAPSVPFTIGSDGAELVEGDLRLFRWVRGTCRQCRA
jgi:hypothetical protein